MIQEICINPKYYPKRYRPVPRWMKKFFKIKQKMIPKFIYLELLSAIFFVILGLVDIVICLCAKEKLGTFSNQEELIVRIPNANKARFIAQSIEK